jgi:hypothetical protein
MPRLSLLLRVALAALLCAALQSALLHPLKHLDAQGAYVHVGGGHGHAPGGPGDKKGANPLCDTIAAVAACIGGSASAFFLALPGSESLELPRAGAPRGAPSPAYRSQAPPPLS